MDIHAHAQQVILGQSGPARVILERLHLIFNNATRILTELETAHDLNPNQVKNQIGQRLFHSLKNELTGLPSLSREFSAAGWREADCRIALEQVEAALNTAVDFHVRDGRIVNDVHYIRQNMTAAAILIVADYMKLKP